MSSTLTPASTPLARQARERFVAHMQGALPELVESIRTALADQMNAAQSSRAMQQKRDQLVEFERAAAGLVDAAARAWRRAVVPPTATGRVRKAEEEEPIGRAMADHIVVNDDLDATVDEMLSIIESHRRAAHSADRA